MKDDAATPYETSLNLLLAARHTRVAGHYVSALAPPTAVGVYTSTDRGNVTPGGYVSAPARAGIGSYVACSTE